MVTTEAKRKRLEEERQRAEKEIEELEKLKELLLDSGLKGKFQSERRKLRDLVLSMKRLEKVMTPMANEIKKLRGWETEFPLTDVILIDWLCAGHGERAIIEFYGDSEK